MFSHTHILLTIPESALALMTSSYFSFWFLFTDLTEKVWAGLTILQSGDSLAFLTVLTVSYVISSLNTELVWSERFESVKSTKVLVRFLNTNMSVDSTRLVMLECWLTYPLYRSWPHGWLMLNRRSSWRWEALCTARCSSALETDHHCLVPMTAARYEPAHPPEALRGDSGAGGELRRKALI